MARVNGRVNGQEEKRVGGEWQLPGCSFGDPERSTKEERKNGRFSSHICRPRQAHRCPCLSTGLLVDPGGR